MEELRKKIRSLFGEYIPAHDIKHVLRVAKMAREIAYEEGVNEDMAEAAGLVHDLGRIMRVADADHAEAGANRAKELLEEYTKFSKEEIEEVVAAVSQHSGKESKGMLANILQDADKLDGLGAIGLLRATVSSANLVDYEQEISTKVSSPYPRAKTIMEQIGFQMEWKEMLYTDMAKKIAKERFEFMEKFVEELKREVRETQ